MGWELPTAAEIGGREYPINTDYRDILEIIGVLQDLAVDARIRAAVALSLFYDDFEEMPPEYHQEAADRMMAFIACGEEDDGSSQPKLIDWEQDRMMIAAEVNRVAGIEIRALEYLHWWTFIAYFSAIGEGQLSMVVAIRDKLARGKRLEKYEQEFYSKHRSRVDFKRKYTPAEDALLQKWLK